MIQQDTNDYLVHYGVLGMKWGVRKNRSKSSSGGKKRSSKQKTEKQKMREQEKAIKKDRKSASRKRRLLSDRELNDMVTRLEKEKKLKQLTEEDTAPGRTAVKKFAKNPVVRSAALGTAAFALKVAISERFGKEAADYIAPNPNRKKK